MTPIPEKNLETITLSKLLEDWTPRDPSWSVEVEGQSVWFSYIKPDHYRYEFEVRMDRDADYLHMDMLDWISHLSEKTWITASDLGELAIRFKAALRSRQ